MATVDPMLRKLFEGLVRQHHRSLLTFATALTHDPQRADEVVQDALVIAFERLDDYDPTRDFSAWLRGIIRNRAREKRAWAFRITAADSSEDLAGADRALEEVFSGWDRQADHRQDLLRALDHCLSGLADLLAAPIRLFYFGNCTVLDIANQLQASEVAIKKRLQRARGLLSNCIRQRLQTEGGQHG